MTNIYHYLNIVATAATNRSNDAYAEELNDGVLFIIACAYDIDTFEKGVKERVDLLRKDEEHIDDAKSRIEADRLILEFVRLRRREIRIEQEFFN